MSSASIEETREAIDNALRSRGVPYNGYSCTMVSWDDVSRGTVGDNLSCCGSNITDTYLKGRDGKSLYTVRAGNWNERLGHVRASDVTLLHGNCVAPSDQDSPQQELKSASLQQFLDNPHMHGGAYSGIREGVVLADSERDAKVSIRFQTVFLPICDSGSDSGRQTFEFATEAYSYNTMSDDDPRNLVVLVTTQGLALQADGVGPKRLMHHSYSGSEKAVRQFWLEAERSDHGVGGAQVETEPERADAEQRGKATSREIGIAAMGARFNTLMTIQIPLRPKTEAPGMILLGAGPGIAGPIHESVNFCSEVAPLSDISIPESFPETEDKRKLDMRTTQTTKKDGISNAARVSRGSDAGEHTPLKVESPERNAAEHVTVTVVFYNTVAGGVPKQTDVVAAIDDMETLLKGCADNGRLRDSKFDFMKNPLDVVDVSTIVTKIVVEQPCQVQGAHISHFQE